jgi:ABC-type transport system involved in cytochrome bd biosynthesis fused ATPase/permease subunit
MLADNPWLIKGTLRQNIIMDQEYDSYRMEKALKYSMLKSTVENFEEGLEMDVGQSSSSVDPLFALKVECARAIYSK